MLPALRIVPTTTLSPSSQHHRHYLPIKAHTMAPSPTPHHRRVSNDIELSLQLHQLRDLQSHLGLFVQDGGNHHHHLPPTNHHQHEEWIDEECGLLLDGSNNNNISSNIVTARRRSSIITASSSATTSEEYHVSSFPSYRDHPPLPLRVAYQRRRMSQQPQYYYTTSPTSGSLPPTSSSRTTTKATTTTILALNNDATTTTPSVVNVIECSSKLLLDESNRSRSSAISWSSTTDTTIRLTNHTDPTVDDSCEGDGSRCDCESGGSGGRSNTSTRRRKQQPRSLINLSKSLRSSIRRSSKRRQQSQLSNDSPRGKDNNNIPPEIVAGQQPSSLPTYDFLQKEHEAKEGGGSIRPATKWWHGVFIFSFISMIACIITLWAPYPFGARMPSATIAATMPSFSNGCIGLQSCICPRATICADDLLSMIFLTIARSTAWFNYPLYMLLFLSKAQNLNNFLQKTALRCWINFSDFHRVHTLFGIVVGLESASHSFFHLLRWARRKNDIQVCKEDDAVVDCMYYSSRWIQFVV